MLLNNLIKKFLQGCLSFQLSPEDIKCMTWEWQQKFLDQTLNNTLVVDYPISKPFTRLFLKKLINYLEQGQDVHDDFYSHLCKVMENEEVKSIFSYRHYLIDDSVTNIISIKETNNMVVNGTTGMKTWDAAFMLTDWALCNKDLFATKDVLELGSGVGFAGIVIGKLCNPQSILLTDCHSEVLETIKSNIELNNPQSNILNFKDKTWFHRENNRIGVMALDWNDILEISENLIPDVIIGADIVYDPSILKPLCTVFKNFVNRNNNVEIYIASVIRNEETFEIFLDILDSMHFDVTKIELSESKFIDWDVTIRRCLLKIKYFNTY